MSYVYKPIDLVELESDYNAYVVIDELKRIHYLKDSQELKDLLKACDEGDDELSIYALQSVVRPEEVNGSDDYNDDDGDDNDSYTDSHGTTTDIDKAIDEITSAFSNSLKDIVLKLKK